MQSCILLAYPLVPLQPRKQESAAESGLNHMPANVVKEWDNESGIAFIQHYIASVVSEWHTQH